MAKRTTGQISTDIKNILQQPVTVDESTLIRTLVETPANKGLSARYATYAKTRLVREHKDEGILKRTKNPRIRRLYEKRIAADKGLVGKYREASNNFARLAQLNTLSSERQLALLQVITGSDIKLRGTRPFNEESSGIIKRAALANETMKKAENQVISSLDAKQWKKAIQEGRELNKILKSKELGDLLDELEKSLENIISVILKYGSGKGTGKMKMFIHWYFDLNATTARQLVIGLLPHDPFPDMTITKTDKKTGEKYQAPVNIFGQYRRAYATKKNGSYDSYRWGLQLKNLELEYGPGDKQKLKEFFEEPENLENLKKTAKEFNLNYSDLLKYFTS